MGPAKTRSVTEQESAKDLGPRDKHTCMLLTLGSAWYSLAEAMFKKAHAASHKADTPWPNHMMI